jgi:hypothetical protein
MAVLLAPDLAYCANPSANLSVQVVPAASVPAGAQAAGFTTLAANYDFSTTAYADPNTNWLDCNNNDPTKVWHKGSPGVYGINCNIHQVVDSLDGSTVMRISLLLSDNCAGSGLAFPSCSVSMETRNESNRFNVNAEYPNMYFETVARIENTFNNGQGFAGPSGAVWSWSDDANAGLSTGTEIDDVEFQSDSGGYANDGSPNWAGGSGPPSITGWTSYAPNNANIPGGWSPTAYHKYGFLETSDGSSDIRICWFIDDVLQSCLSVPSVQSFEFVQRHFLVMTVYGTDGSGKPQGVDRLFDTKYIRIWSCPSWSSTNGSSSGTCNGTTLFNSGGLAYWH